MGSVRRQHPPQPQSMQLCVRMTCGRTVLLECDASDTIGRLHDAISAAEGTTGHSLRFNGRTLGITSATLRECALEAGSMLQAALPLKGGGNGLRTCQRAQVSNTS